MEPRARAGRNVGKSNFNSTELTQFLIAHGDSRPPLPETIRVLDEILTEFIQGVSFEATRAAQLAGRQKVKYEDFQFAMRKNMQYLGKAEENKELNAYITSQRKAFAEDGAGAPGGVGAGLDEEALAAGLAEVAGGGAASVVGKKSRKRKKAGGAADATLKHGMRDDGTAAQNGPTHDGENVDLGVDDDDLDMDDVLEGGSNKA